MLTEAEFNALVQLIQRIPMSALEALAITAILEKIAPKPAQPKQAPPEEVAG